MEKVSVDHAVKVLNEALEMHHDAMLELINFRVPCNEELSNHPTIQVRAYDMDVKYSVGILGIINGIFGIRGAWGHIAIECESEEVDGITVVKKIYRFRSLVDVKAGKKKGA